MCLALLLALPAYADDAPRLDTPTCLDAGQTERLGRRLIALETQVAKQDEALKAAPSTALVVVVAVAAVVVGGAVGYGVARAVPR